MTSPIEPLLYETKDFKIWQDDKGLNVKYLKVGGQDTYSPDLMERIWECVDEGEQPTRWDGTWNVSFDDDWGGLRFSKKIGSGGSDWGMSDSVYSAVLAWRKHHQPKTVKEQTILDLKELRNVLAPGNDSGLEEYENTVLTAIRLLEETLNK